MKYSARYLALAGIVALGGCSRLETSGTRDTASVKQTAAKLNGVDTLGSDTAITMTAEGYGPLLIGMTVANAAAALNSPAPSIVGLDTACAYVHIANAPAGMRIMVSEDTVTRIDIDSNTVATGLGARVGDSETQIHELYDPRVSVQPHKYLPHGHYLIVAPVSPADSSFRLIFETDGDRVTTYRAGRLPQVQWVEGCA